MKNKRKQAVTILVTLVLIAGLSVLGWRLYERTRGMSDYDDAQNIAGVTSSEPPAPPPPEEVEEPKDPCALALLGTDLAALREVNEDVIGWIEIPDTELSYPLLKGEDNQYYLTHTWNKERNAMGSVFMECTNQPDFSQFNTILYAHRMNNDSMFGTLKYYDDLEFWKEHPKVYIVTDAGVRIYDIFAAYQVGVRDIIYRLDLEKSELQSDFIDFCLENSVIDTELVPQPEDSFLTLSTCIDSYSQSDYRWVVLAVLEDIVTEE